MLVWTLLLFSSFTPSHQQSGEEIGSLPLTPRIASAEVVEQNDATCPSAEARNVVKDTLQPLILNTTDNLVACTLQVRGLVSHCPISNCTELFTLAQEEGLVLISNYYWLVGTTGEVRKVYCNRDTQQPEYSSCEDLFELYNFPSGTYTLRSSRNSAVTVFCNNETRQAEYSSCEELYDFQDQSLPLSGIYTIRPSGGVPVIVFCNNETRQAEYFTSCAHVHQLQPDLPSGSYTIQPLGSNPVTVYCDMDSEGCNGGGWTRVASYNYSDPGILCPANWTEVTSLRGCTPGTNGCASSYFPTLLEFNQVCGKVIGIQYRAPDAFRNPDDIESHYVEGVSITHGHPRNHIWTFAAYPSDQNTRLENLCPCSQPSLNVPPPLSFVGNNYFCDTAAEHETEGWRLDDPLWDGQGCPSTSTCCSFNNPPWFSTTLPQSTTDDIEVRICHHHDDFDNTAITQLDLYIK